jgi:hypothetical protein
MATWFQIFSPGAWDRRQRKVVVHIDNPAARNEKVTQNLFQTIPLKRRPQPLYSPNRFPLKLYLFGKVKNAMIEPDIPGEIRFFGIVMYIVDRISCDQMETVLRGSIERVSGVTDAAVGDLFE